MTARNERARRLSAEGEDRLRRELRDAIVEGNDTEADSGKGEHDNPEQGGAGDVDPTNEHKGDAHDAADDGDPRNSGQEPGSGAASGDDALPTARTFNVGGDDGELAGFHSPILTDRADVVGFVAKAFAPGAVICNGHIAFRNGSPAADNEEAASALLDCAGR